MIWAIVPAVTRENKSTTNCLQLSDDLLLFMLPGLDNGGNSVEALMSEISAGTDALHPKQLSYTDGLCWHAAWKVDGAAEKEVAGWHVSVQHIFILPYLGDHMLCRPKRCDTRESDNYKCTCIGINSTLVKQFTNILLLVWFLCMSLPDNPSVPWSPHYRQGKWWRGSSVGFGKRWICQVHWGKKNETRISAGYNNLWAHNRSKQ